MEDETEDVEQGHDEWWTSPTDAENKKCPICHLVARDAVSHTCGELFCQSCWRKLGRRPRCPNCRGSGDAVPAYRDRREVLNLMVHCPRGCGRDFRLGDERHHLAEICARRFIPCPKCSENVRADALQFHEQSECVFREIRCSDCGVETLACLLPSHKEEKCVCRLVACPLCGDFVQWRELPAHFNGAVGRHVEGLLRANSNLGTEISELKAEISSVKEENLRLRTDLRQLQGTKAKKRRRAALIEVGA